MQRLKIYDEARTMALSGLVALYEEILVAAARSLVEVRAKRGRRLHSRGLLSLKHRYASSSSSSSQFEVD